MEMNFMTSSGMIPGKPSFRVTVRRLRAHGLILALCLWSVYAWNVSSPGLRDRMGNLKGTDFLHLYTLGSLAVAHRGSDLYDAEAQARLVAIRVPEAAGNRYLPLYPPQVSILFAPFAEISYRWALALWLALSAVIYGGCCYAIWRNCPNLREYKSTVIILAVAFPAFWHLILWGQTSALALACFTLAFIALRNHRGFLAGLAIGLLIFKPQLALASAIVFVFTLQWRVILGALLSSVAQLAAGWSYYGFGPFREWMRALTNAPQQPQWLEPRPYQTHCLRTFWSMLVPWTSASVALYLLSAVLVCFMAIVCWRSRLPLSLRYSALLFATVLIAPHLTVYDLVILAPAFLLLADQLVECHKVPIGSRFTVWLYLAFFLPLVGPFARWTHFQLSVAVMALIVFELWNYGRKSDSTHAAAELTNNRRETAVLPEIARPKRLRYALLHP
jgi:hypothetical protein